MSDNKFNMNSFVSFLNGKKKAFGGGGNEKKDIPKIKYFKPEVGDVNIRWLMHSSFEESGTPAFVVYYYDNPALFGERRAVAPFQFGLEDPIATYVEEKRKTRLSDVEFKQVLKLMPKASYMIPLVVRGKEAEGVMIWELNDKRFKEVALATIAHPDYQDDLILDPIKGRDVLIKGQLSGKVFNGKETISWTPSVRAKTTKLAPSEAEIEKLLASIQDPVAVAKEYVRKADYYQKLLSTALSSFQNGGLTTGNDGTSRGSMPERSSEGSRSSVESALDDAFDGDIPF